jgi:hypothetical protein
VDEQQEQQIREWAAALGERDDPERRAVGRAMLMMLDEIAMLRDRLARAIEAEQTRTGEPPPAPREAPAPERGEGEQETAPLRLRDRIRHVAERHSHHDDE